MSNSQRQKGLVGEREVAAIFAAAGYSVRNLEGEGDALAIGLNGDLMHVEVKRQERLKLWEWIRQAESETPPNVPPFVVFRKNNDVWRQTSTLADLLAMIS